VEGIGGDIITGTLDIFLEELRNIAKNLWVICAISGVRTEHSANAGQKLARLFIILDCH
jgi:hypothetical protein